MAEAFGLFEYPQTSSSKPIPLILNRKRKTQSKSFMVSTYFGTCMRALTRQFLNFINPFILLD